jgi:DNA repair photolyase
MRPIQAKTLLSRVHGEDSFFGLTYNMNLYRGCGHGCIYCDSRSSCYGIENFSDILYKENALELLDREIRSKRVKGTIGFGSMNDPYMPAERELQLTRHALEIVARHEFPAHIITKGTLVTRDIDILKIISRTYAAVSFTITTEDDSLSKRIEPGAPVSSERFAAIKTLSGNGIYCGITLMPVLPFITDSEENIAGIIRRAALSGAKYIIAAMGMTLREGQREYFYAALDRSFPGLKERYMKKYGSSYSCSVPNHNELSNLFRTECGKYGIATRIERYREPQMSMF